MHHPSRHLHRVVNVGNAVDDRRFALKATAKATVPAATVLKQIFYKQSRRARPPEPLLSLEAEYLSEVEVAEPVQLSLPLLYYEVIHERVVMADDS
ncbi:hypothetical protein ACLOJK_014601 [Asimina triloba]